jgi:phospholipid/cholesterol/gamma-HCH transport system ATP-binding protein
MAQREAPEGQDETPILEFERTWLPLSDDDGAGVFVDLAVGPGDLVLVDPGDEVHERALADGACGLLSPTGGAVRFLGRDWTDMPPDHANAMRGRIGHVFRVGEWVPYLSVEDNVLLAPLHHTNRPRAEIREQAARLAVQFGLPGLPVRSPGELSSRDRRRAAYIGAFLGMPDLIVIESPRMGLVVELMTPLINAIRKARDRNAAVLWFMHENRLWFEPSVPATGRVRLQGRQIVAAGDAR